MNRHSYFPEINNVPSPLLLLTEDTDLLIQIRASELCDNIDLYRSFSNQLKRHNSEAAQTRAEFILRQLEGDISEHFFLNHCEKWGIPIFKEELVTAADFKYGFLWTFRDHSTSYVEDQEARHWFYTHKEAQFIMNYEFWHCDNGNEEISIQQYGSYAAIIRRFVKQQQYEALISPIFSKTDLRTFMVSYDEEREGLPIEDVLEILENNPNWNYKTIN